MFRTTSLSDKIYMLQSLLEYKKIYIHICTNNTWQSNRNIPCCLILYTAVKKYCECYKNKKWNCEIYFNISPLIPLFLNICGNFLSLILCYFGEGSIFIIFLSVFRYGWYRDYFTIWEKIYLYIFRIYQ